MRILAIETSCDETAIVLVEAKGRLPAGRQGLNPSAGSGPRFKILKNLVASQVKIHRPYGGVVPSLAKREHLKNLPILFQKIFPAEKFFNNIDLIAVTVGPGLEPALWTGINFAKEIYKRLKIKNKKLKIIGISHLEGHLYSNFLEPKTYNLKPETLFPAVALLVSGGHTILLLMKDMVHYKKLGETRDDAVGECFDKVARLLNLPYPGGPEIEKIAKSGSSTSIDFPRPMINQKNYDFSFSGLKTAVLYYLKNSEANIFSPKPAQASPVNSTKLSYGASGHGVRAERGRASRGTSELASLGRAISALSGKDLASNVAASFQTAAFDVLISKTLRAVQEFKAKSILISGGVASNKILQKQFKSEIENCLPAEASAQAGKLKINFLVPLKNFCTDNAVMIAAAGYLNYLKRKKRQLIAQGNLSLN